MKTIQLQSVGHVPAVEASELREGDVRMYNFGSTSLIVKVIEKSAKTLTIITFSEEGKYYMSDIRKTTLVSIVERDQDITSHHPQEVYNVSGKNKGMVDVSEYFPVVEEVEVIEAQEEVVTEDTELNVQKEINYIEEATTKSRSVKNAYYQLNNELNGVEIYFNDKPSEEVREQLKSNRFRWSRNNKCWYAKQSDNTITLAKRLTESQEEKTITEVSYPEIEINDIESYTIDQSLQDREHDSGWIFRSSKRDHSKEVQDLFSSYTDKVTDVLKNTESEYIIYKLKQSLQYFKKSYHQTYISFLSHKANNPSWAVTGRGNLNVSKYNKSMNREDNLRNKLFELTSNMDSNIKKYSNKIKRENKFKVS
ncbi:hypothetical protein [Niallia taxi]|uniref:hypothetical protein n=1 Tax=Niallia taxi TaxID=2499688 RepID=UPI0030091464